MRYDVFIIFPHGIDKIDEILKILYKYPDLELLYIRKYKPERFTEFIENIYKTDTVPWEHIRGKTRYLEKMGGEVFVLLVKNKAPEEVVVGEGEFKHIQCMLVNRFKWEVREKFNPVIGGERSEHHVIHATDYEEQTGKLWPQFGFDAIETITNIPNPVFPYVPFFVGPFGEYKIIEVDLLNLRCFQMQKDGKNYQVPIVDSIYYRYVKGIKQPYIDYWNELRGVKLLTDSSPMKFDKLIEEIDINRLFREYIVINEDLAILDGNHRASIALSRDVWKLPAIQVKWSQQ